MGRTGRGHILEFSPYTSYFLCVQLLESIIVNSLKYEVRGANRRFSESSEFLLLSHERYASQIPAFGS
jgi:hypothetical protein